MFSEEAQTETGEFQGKWFATTLWNVVVTAGLEAGTSDSHAALEKLCRAYWRPLYVFVRSRGYSPHDAEDLTQEFFARILESNCLNRAKADRGRFRSFLLGALKNFLADEFDRSRAVKRGGGRPLFSIDDADLATLIPSDSSTEASPEKAYEKRWAITLLEQAMERLRKEYSGAGKRELFEELKKFLTGDSKARDYSEAAVALSLTANHVAVNVHRLRGRYRELVRFEVANTVSAEKEVDEEMRHLLNVLST